MKTFILFGSTGDLATRYVLPALGTLLQKGVYDHLICVGRRDWTRDDFRAFLAPYPDLLNHTETVYYVKLDIQSKDYSSLKDKLIETNGSNLGGDIISHLCLSPEYFVDVAKGLHSIGLGQEDNGINTKENSRIMIEKPFGYDLESARNLNLQLQEYFQEKQIYRVDHYLGKNYVQEFYEYKMSGENSNIWNDEYIKEIRVVAREALAMEGRGEYYDKSGATRDFLQNHLLQILSIVTMEKPYLQHQDNVQASKLFALQSIKPLLVDQNHEILMGQYDGYRDEQGVDENSRTETYIRVHLKLDAPWANTDIILETGKAMDKKESSITLVFQNGSEVVFAETPENKNNSYETLIGKAFKHDTVFFVPWENVEAAWHVVDDLLNCARTGNCPILRIYKQGSREV